MEHPLRAPESRRQLVGVYADEALAEQARRRLLAAGVAAEAMEVGGHRNEVASLRAEMREEIGGGFVPVGPVPVGTREAQRGRSLVIPAVWAVTFLVLLPFSLIDWGLSLGLRVVVMAAIAAAVAVAYGLVVGAAVAARRPDEPLAAHRGVTLRVAADSADLRAAMTFEGLIRLDEVSLDDEPMSTVTTEHELHHETTVSEIAANVHEGTDQSPHDRQGDDTPPRI